MWLLNLYKKSNSSKMKKFLIVGLGNIGEEYNGTRHNIGFEILNELTKEYGKNFEVSRYAHISKFNFKGNDIYCISQNTPVGKALIGKKVNETFSFNNTKNIINEII